MDIKNNFFMIPKSNNMICLFSLSYAKGFCRSQREVLLAGCGKAKVTSHFKKSEIIFFLLSDFFFSFLDYVMPEYFSFYRFLLPCFVYLLYSNIQNTQGESESRWSIWGKCEAFNVLHQKARREFVSNERDE